MSLGGEALCVAQSVGPGAERKGQRGKKASLQGRIWRSGRMEGAFISSSGSLWEMLEWSMGYVYGPRRKGSRQE